MDSPFRGLRADESDGGKTARSRAELFGLQGKTWVLMRGESAPKTEERSAFLRFFSEHIGDHTHAPAPTPLLPLSRRRDSPRIFQPGDSTIRMTRAQFERRVPCGDYLSFSF